MKIEVDIKTELDSEYVINPRNKLLAIAAEEEVDVKIQRKLACFDHVVVKQENVTESEGSNFVEQVFGQDMLREMILSYLLEPCNADPSTRRDLRLVQKSWRHSVSSCLIKSYKPLFRFILDQENSTTGTPYTLQHGKLLDAFITSTAAFNAEDPSISIVAPFSLHLLPHFFRDSNYESLYNCFLKCGSGLVSLKVQFPFRETFPLIFPPFTLPNLQEITIKFSLGPKVDSKTEANRVNVIYPLQTILNASINLKSLSFIDNPSDIHIPFGFKYLSLPQSLVKLSINSRVKTNDLEFLATNTLPNLEELHLFATNVAFGQGLTFRILNNLRESLKNLQLLGEYYFKRLTTTNKFRFPVMEKLQVLQICGQCWELEEGLFQLETHLPVLESVRLTKVSETLFKRLTDKSVFPAAKHVSLHLIDEEATQSRRIREEYVPLTVTVETMQIIDKSFPNVIDLDIVLCGEEQTGLVYLFERLGRLEKLTITVKDDHSGEEFNSDCWHATLIGAPLELVSVLKRCPEYWANVDLKDEFVSVRDLTALKSLTILDDVTTFGESENSKEQVFVSDIIFHFAFLKMPVLEQLQLTGNFAGSAETMHTWRSQSAKREPPAS